MRAMAMMIISLSSSPHPAVDKQPLTDRRRPVATAELVVRLA